MKNLTRATVILVIFLATSTTIGSSAQDDARTGAGQYCKQTSYGPCRTIHGRYGIYVENNGIVDLASHELLSTAGDRELDAMIRSAGGEFDHEVLGEFVVCPTSARRRPERTRAVQDVCVQSHKQVKVVKSTRNDIKSAYRSNHRPFGSLAEFLSGAKAQFLLMAFIRHD